MPADWTIPGALVLGEHGPAYEPVGEPETVTVYLACGVELEFEVPPSTGEQLYCRKHDEYETCVVVGELVVGCDDCDWTLPVPPHQERGAINRMVRRHATGPRTVAHSAKLGRRTRGGVEWTAA